MIKLFGRLSTRVDTSKRTPRACECVLKYMNFREAYLTRGLPGSVCHVCVPLYQPLRVLGDQGYASVVWTHDGATR